jgi:hypothetical protein
VLQHRPRAKRQWDYLRKVSRTTNPAPPHEHKSRSIGDVLDHHGWAVVSLKNKHACLNSKINLVSVNFKVTRISMGKESKRGFVSLQE